MSVYVGGRRARLIHDSMYLMIRDALAALGWFDPDREHQAITLIPQMLEPHEPIQLNTIAVAPSDENDSDVEMGSNLSENRTTYYADIYAENEALGVDLKGDIRDILRGKMTAIGRSRPILEVRDLTQPTPPVIFLCEIENVVVDRAPNFDQPWQRHWWVVRFDLLDYYGDDADEEP